MALNDVWRNISEEIRIYWKGRFSNVPMTSGIYAWFYPLRLSTYDLSAFMKEINRVHSYDARSGGLGEREINAQFTWQTISLKVRRDAASNPLPLNVEREWNRIRQDEMAFQRLRKVLLKSSLFMPPLYVGKTKCLNIRCAEHLRGGDSSGFHERFIEFAKRENLTSQDISDLIFACIQTGGDLEDVEGDYLFEDVLEEIAKRLAMPPYSAR